MACWTQQGLTLGCHISFETITGGGNKGTLCNSSNKRNEVLEVYGGYILKSLRGLTIEQEDKRLHCRVGNQVQRSKV